MGNEYINFILASFNEIVFGTLVFAS